MKGQGAVRKDGQAGSVGRSRRLTSGPTIADVARAAGVSPMTVSRVVNGGSNVQAETHERVTAAIARLDYRPNLAARSLAGGRQCRIAFLYANPSSAYLSELLVGCLEETAVTDAQLIVERCAEDSAPAEIVQLILKHRTDAVLLPPPLSDSEALLRALHRQGLAVVQVAAGEPLAFAHAVNIDDQAAAHAMTSRLIGLGHRRIGFIGGKPNQAASAGRRQGFLAALAEADLAPDPAMLVDGDFTFRSGLSLATDLLSKPDRPTAIFASNDDMASGAVAAAHRLGLDVPLDVSICGFDDSAAATSVWPELTTIRQPVADMARRACQMLVAASASGSDAKAASHEVFPFELVVRESDGKVSSQR